MTRSRRSRHSWPRPKMTFSSLKKQIVGSRDRYWFVQNHTTHIFVLDFSRIGMYANIYRSLRYHCQNKWTQEHTGLCGCKIYKNRPEVIFGFFLKIFHSLKSTRAYKIKQIKSLYVFLCLMLYYTVI